MSAYTHKLGSLTACAGERSAHDPDIPRPITLVVLAANAAIPFFVWRVFAARASRRVSIGLAVFVFGWFALSLLLAPPPASLLARERFYLTPLIPFFAVGSLVVAAAALLLSHGAREAVRTASRCRPSSRFSSTGRSAWSS